jgi:GTPase SAR1 family protein
LPADNRPGFCLKERHLYSIETVAQSRSSETGSNQEDILMTTTTTNEQYEQYQEVQKNRSVLVDLIQRQLGVLQKLSMTGKTEETLQRLQQQVSTEKFKVLIIGEFKRGKSTFINALLGNKVLPAYAIPCTAIISEIKWGASPRALLHYTQSEDGSVKQPQEIPIDQIEQYVVIKDDPSEINGNPYEKVELFWSLELCQNGVELIDSPGLNEHDTRQKITIDYLSSADAILFLLSCEALASQSELNVIDNNLKSMGYEEIFIICNRFDLIRAEEREAIKRYGLSKLAPLTKRKDEGVFFISALEALEGRQHGDNERVNKSGILQLEKELQEFLTKGRGRLKILQSARKLQLAISEAREIIPQRQAMLQTDFKTLEARYDAAQEPLSNLETKHRQLVERASNFCEDMRESVRKKTRTFYKSLPSKVEECLKNYEPKSSVKFLSLEGTKPQIEE